VDARDALEALLITLWLDMSIWAVSTRLKACTTASFSRTIRLWATTPAKDLGLRGAGSALHVIWTGYLGLLSRAQTREWQQRLQAQAMPPDGSQPVVSGPQSGQAPVPKWGIWGLQRAMTN